MIAVQEDGGLGLGCGAGQDAPQVRRRALGGAHLHLERAEPVARRRGRGEAGLFGGPGGYGEVGHDLLGPPAEPAPQRYAQRLRQRVEDGALEGGGRRGRLARARESLGREPAGAPDVLARGAAGQAAQAGLEAAGRKMRLHDGAGGLRDALRASSQPQAQAHVLGVRLLSERRDERRFQRDAHPLHVEGLDLEK
ncbi:MAG: hypothetical protein NTX64_14490 [Elusimicrobia bacterium]|nr:hypothetical protein [Elusimicrobiota bacterium]